MAKRTKAAAVETREQILDAAELCFRDIGVARTTLQMVAARAGCTRGAIYWHFSEKHELLRQVIERAPLSLFVELETINRVAEPVAALRRCLLRSLDVIQGDRHLRNVIEVTLFRGEYPEELSGELALGKAAEERLLRLLRRIFESGRSRGELKTAIAPQTLACLVFCVFSGALRNCILLPANSWMVREGITVLNMVFAIAAGDMEACNEQLRCDFRSRGLGGDTP